MRGRETSDGVRMTLDAFIAAQREVIAEFGIDAYLPTLWVDTPRTVRVSVLEPAPAQTDADEVTRPWAL